MASVLIAKVSTVSVWLWLHYTLLFCSQTIENDQKLSIVTMFVHKYHSNSVIVNCWPKFKDLFEFITSWISLFAHSPKTRFMWLEQTGKSMASYSPTWWWSCWEVIEQVSVQFGRGTPNWNPALKSFFYYFLGCTYSTLLFCCVMKSPRLYGYASCCTEESFGAIKI